MTVDEALNVFRDVLSQNIADAWDKESLRDLVLNLKFYVENGNVPLENYAAYRLFIEKTNDCIENDSEFPVDDAKYMSSFLFLLNLSASYMRTSFCEVKHRYDDLSSQINTLLMLNEPPSGTVS